MVVPFAAFLGYYYCYFLPKARKERNSEYRNFWDYWASKKDYEKRSINIAKNYSKEEREILIKLAETKQNSHYNLEIIGMFGLILYVLDSIFPLENVVIIILVSIPVYIMMEKLKSEERATYTKFIEDLIWSDCYDKN